MSKTANLIFCDFYTYVRKKKTTYVSNITSGAFNAFNRLQFYYFEDSAVTL